MSCGLDRRRLRFAALLPALALGVAGCHHKAPVAYQPPPPPPVVSGKRTSGASWSECAGYEAGLAGADCTLG